MPAYTIPHNQHHGNQEILDDNREHFGAQSEIVLRCLQRGEMVSSLRMIREYGIIDTRARVFSLKKAGYQIGERKIPKGKGAKEWFLIKTTLFE